MKRRQFFGTAAVAPVVTVAVRAAAQAGPPVTDPVEKMTAPPRRPTITINHLGFRPRVGSKTLVVRALASPPPREYTLRDVSERHFSFTRPLTEMRSESGPELGPDLGPCLTADFTDLDRPGLYQITVGGSNTQCNSPSTSRFGAARCPRRSATIATNAAAWRCRWSTRPATSTTHAAAIRASM